MSQKKDFRTYAQKHQESLGQALRENLKKRKQQQRNRAKQMPDMTPNNAKEEHGYSE